MPPLKKTKEELEKWFDSYSVDLALWPSEYGVRGVRAYQCSEQLLVCSASASAAKTLVGKYKGGGFKIHCLRFVFDPKQNTLSSNTIGSYVTGTYILNREYLTISSSFSVLEYLLLNSIDF